MATPPIPMPMRPPGPGGPGAPGAPGGGIGLPKSPIGGPSGPGGSPMVSPGTGAGMQARSKERVSKIMDDLLEVGASFEKGSTQFNAIARAIAALNGVFKGAAAPEAPKQPLPVPATAPGAGLGGMGAPPPGLPSPTGGPMGGMGGLAPGGDVG